jgi:hypothetical protein
VRVHGFKQRKQIFGAGQPYDSGIPSISSFLPRQRNLWVTDAFEWRPEVGLAQPPNAG